MKFLLIATLVVSASAFADASMPSSSSTVRSGSLDATTTSDGAQRMENSTYKSRTTTPSGTSSSKKTTIEKQKMESTRPNVNSDSMGTGSGVGTGTSTAPVNP